MVSRSLLLFSVHTAPTADVVWWWWWWWCWFPGSAPQLLSDGDTTLLESVEYILVSEAKTDSPDRRALIKAALHCAGILPVASLSDSSAAESGDEDIKEGIAVAGGIERNLWIALCDYHSRFGL